MLPYFKYTEEIHTFCLLIGYTIGVGVYLDAYVCTYNTGVPYITSYNLNSELDPYIPEAKVIDYLTLILNGYSYADAIKEIGVVGYGRSPAS